MAKFHSRRPCGSACARRRCVVARRRRGDGARRGPDRPRSQRQQQVGRVGASGVSSVSLAEVAVRGCCGPAARVRIRAPAWDVARAPASPPTHPPPPQPAPPAGRAGGRGLRARGATCRSRPQSWSRSWKVYSLRAREKHNPRCHPLQQSCSIITSPAWAWCCWGCTFSGVMLSGASFWPA